MKRHRSLFPLVVIGSSTLLTASVWSGRHPDVSSRPTVQVSTLIASDSTMDAARRQRLVDSLIVQMEREYVFPGKVPALAASLRQRLKRGDYENITSAVAFADTLTAHVRQVIADRHLSIRFFPTRRPPATRAAGTAAPSSTASRRPGPAWVERVEVLTSNIGYLVLSGFADRADAEAPYRDAMTKLADTDALIIDIRENRGGHPEGVALLISYLVGRDSIHLNSFHFRNDSTMQTWTSPVVAGRKFGPDKPVYVLTSATTFSAAEEFAYDLQAIRRGTIIGEVTGGGANPGQVIRLDANMAAFIPFAEARNPITGTNWEGVGVRPEIQVPAAVALDRALEEIARRRTQRSSKAPRWRR